MTRILQLVASFAVLASGRAAAQTDRDACAPEVLDALGRHVHVERMAPSDEDGVVVAAACRVWPSDPRTVLAAVAYDAGVRDHKTLLVAMLDRRTLRVRRSY
jgi:hypothetical protein